MELNWSTFVLEIINFLVLVWILKRFLYQPVLGVIARRRQAIEKQLADAHQLRDQAEDSKLRYENRLADWNQERQQALDKLHVELEQKRQEGLSRLKTELAEEMEKNRIAETRQQKQIMREMQQQALNQGAQFASRLLGECAGPELEQRLFDILMDDLRALSEEQSKALAGEWGESPEQVVVCSAYALPDEQKLALQQSLKSVLGQPVPVQYERDRNLLAGLRITIGAWVLNLNVRDELQGFTEFSHVEQ